MDPQKTEDQVTVVMTAYGNSDFTNASLWALRKVFRDRVILADGWPVAPQLIEPWGFWSNAQPPSDFKKYTNTQIIKLCSDYIHLPDACAEDLRNAAASLVRTKYILFMDNDTKVLHREAIDLLIEAMQQSKVAQTGAYGIRLISREKRKAYVGNEFTDHMEIDASPAYFSMHDTGAYRMVGGMPKEFFYEVPEELRRLKQPGYSGDMSISIRYQNIGWRIVSPRAQIPVLHWGQANRWFNSKRPVEDWWYKNVTHIRCNPLNDYVKYEDTSPKQEEKNGES